MDKSKYISVIFSQTLVEREPLCIEGLREVTSTDSLKKKLEYSSSDVKYSRICHKLIRLMPASSSLNLSLNIYVQGYRKVQVG